MFLYLKSVVLLSLIYPLFTAYICPQISQFYIDCSNLHTLNESINFCSQYGMTLLNLTNSTTATLLTSTLQLINCANDFWYSYGNQTGLTGNIGTSTGGLICSIIPLLGLYCVSSSVVQAITICFRNDPIEIQQKCSYNDSNQRLDLQKFIFTRKTTYASIFNIFQSHSQTQCNSICSKNNECIGTNYEDSNCTLYL